MKKGWVYILSNASNNVVYIGVTSNLEQRIAEHKSHLIDGFTKRYNVDKLVYVEEYESIEEAITREKQLKGWRRAKKDKLIESLNPAWRDLTSS